MRLFINRREAGRRLATHLIELADGPDVIVLALSRGGVPVAYEIARALRAPLDVVVVRTLGVPGHPEHAYRGSRPRLHLAGRTAILVDDGLATEATMAAAVAAVEQQHAAKIIVAVPVASRDAVAKLSATGHAVVAETTPEPFRDVGDWYEDFAPTSDAELRTLLAAGWRDQVPLRPVTEPGPPGDPPVLPIEARRAGHIDLRCPVRRPTARAREA